MQSAPGVTTPTTPSKLAELVAKFPEPDKRSGVLSDADKEAMDGAVAEIYRGGKDSVVALVEMLEEPRGRQRDGEGDAEAEEGDESRRRRSDSQARHALHAVVMHAGKLGDEHRRSLAEALASTLGQKTRPASAQAFVVRQLQLCGGPETAKALGPLLLDERLYSDAAMALLKVGDAAAAEQFRASLPKATGRRLVTVIHGLGTLKDVKSVEALTKYAAQANREVSTVATWAVANIRDGTTSAADPQP